MRLRNRAGHYWASWSKAIDQSKNPVANAEVVLDESGSHHTSHEDGLFSLFLPDVLRTGDEVTVSLTVPRLTRSTNRRVESFAFPPIWLAGAWRSVCCPRDLRNSFLIFNYMLWSRHKNSAITVRYVERSAESAQQKNSFEPLKCRFL